MRDRNYLNHEVIRNPHAGWLLMLHTGESYRNWLCIVTGVTVFGDKLHELYAKGIQMKIEGKYAASNFFRRQGLILDTDKKCYTKSNKIVSLFTFYDDCQKLPKLDYILMFRTLYAKCEPCAMEDFENASMIQLSLVYNKNRRLIVHETRNFSEIKEMANELATIFNLRIRDSASDRRNPKWL